MEYIHRWNKTCWCHLFQIITNIQILISIIHLTWIQNKTNTNFFDQNYFSIQQVNATSNDCEVCLGFRVLLTLQSSHLLNHWRHRTDVRSKCTLSKLIQDGWFFSTHTISGPELCLLRLSSAYKQFQTIIPIRERERERERDPISCEHLETWLITEWRLLGWLFHHLTTRIQLRVHILFAETC
jgi:hypothetical protein